MRRAVRYGTSIGGFIAGSEREKASRGDDDDKGSGGERDKNRVRRLDNRGRG